MCSPSWSPLPPLSPSHPSGFSQCTSPEHSSHASNLGWWSVSPLIVYLFQCYSLRTAHPRLKNHWSIVDLKCSIRFCCIAKLISCTYIFFILIYNYGLSQGIEYSSLCCTVGPCCFLHLIYSQVVLVVKNPAANAREMRHKFNSWTGKILWKKALHPMAVFLPGESHGQRGVMSYSP